MPDWGVILGAMHQSGARDLEPSGLSWEGSINGGCQARCRASVLSVKVGQVTTHAPDNLMRSTCFYTDCNLQFLP